MLPTRNVVTDANQKAQQQAVGTEGTQPTNDLPPAAPSGRRQAFRDLRRQLSDADLTTPGVPKLLLDEIEKLEAELDQLRGYVERYHAANTRACVLEADVRTVRAIEVLFAVGVGLGGAILGLAPYFWTLEARGGLCLAIGIVLIAGACVGRLVKK